MSSQNNHRRENKEVPPHRMATQVWWISQPYEEEGGGFVDVGLEDEDSVIAEIISEISSAQTSLSSETDNLSKWEFINRASGSATAAAQLTEPVFTASTDDASDVADEDIAPVLDCNAYDEVPDISRVEKHLHLTKTTAEILVHQPVVLDAFYVYKTTFMTTAPGAVPVHSKDILPQYIRIKRW